MQKDVKIPMLEADVLKKNISRQHPKSALLALGYSNEESSYESTIGGIFHDHGYYWMAKGSTLVVASSESHSVVSMYDFDKTFHDVRFSIQTCHMQHNLIIIGLKTSDGEGCIAVYQPLRSQLIKAISIPYPVTTLEIISCVGGAVAETKCLNKNLRYLFGIVSVGTEEGYIYLVDLRLDVQDGIGSLPKPLDILQPTSRNVPMMRENASSECKHLAFELQALSHEDGVFHFILPGDEILESYYPSYADVTCMLYEPRVSSIFIGYRFGQFQIFSLQTLMLVYSSEYESHTPPVLRFAFQEPENDPRKYCYLWVAKGNETSEENNDSQRHPLSISMFQLGYARKNAISTPSRHPTHDFQNNKVQYGDFEACCPRFQHLLGPTLMSNASQCCETSLLMCSTIEKHAVSMEQQDETEGLDVEYGMSPSSSICIFGWRTHSENGSSQLHALVFDINRWYMAQMPRCLCGDEGDDLYLGYWSFDNESSSLPDDQRELAMHVPADKIRIYASGRKPLPEKFIYPSASSFQLQCLTIQHIYNHSLYGHQQEVLNSMHSLKSMCLVNPKELHSDLLSSALFTTHKRNQALTPDMMRENILTAALEHGRTSFLLNVIKELASGQLAACGCTIRFVMDWAWKSVAHIKSAIDDLSVPIFDCSIASLDVNLKHKLWFNTTLMYHLRILFQKMLDYVDDATYKSKEEVRTKLNVTTLIYQYLKAVQWFISNGLLPEQFDDADSDEEMLTPNGILIYKYSRLRRVFDQRRNELKRLNCPDVLLIDGWIADIGEALTSRWEKSDGGKPNYPPVNIMTLLDTYYLDCVDVSTKHCLVLYLLNDLVAMLTTLQTEDNTFNQTLHCNLLESFMGFLQCSDVPTSLIKLTQGFWLLDHKHFQEALNIFLDPLTSQLQATWQQRRILKAFLYQAHPAMALKYLSVCQPKIENADDAKMHVTVYIKNSAILKAWNLVLLTAGQFEEDEVFSHMFTLSQQNSLLDQLLQLPLTQKEESIVVGYLRRRDDAHATQLLILFYLQQNRYTEAIKLHSRTKHIRLMRDQDDESRKQNVKLDHIIQAYINVLPKIERDMLLKNIGFGNRRTFVQKEVHKLKAIPAVLHPSSNVGPRSKSEHIAFRIDKMDRQKRTTQEPVMTPLRRKPFSRSGNNTLGFSDIPMRFSSISGSAVTERLSSLSVPSLLLQTPPIVRRRPSMDRKEFPPSIQTPQSILKVKTNLLKRDWVPTPSPLARGPEMLREIQDHVKDDLDESENDFNETSDHYKIITDIGLESAEDTLLVCPWQQGQVSKLHSTSIESERFFHSVVSKYAKTELPVISTPHYSRIKRDPLLIDILQDSLEEPTIHVQPRPPMISTPTVKRLELRKDESFDNDLFHSTGIDTPRKIRFQGLDSTANDLDLSTVMEPVPSGQVSGSTHVVMKAEDSDDASMEVDVLGDETSDILVSAECDSATVEEIEEGGADDLVVLEESGLSEQYLDCEQDTPHDDTIDLLSSTDDDASDFKQEAENSDKENLNLVVSSSDSEAVEADDEQEGDESEEFSVHEVPSSEAEIVEVTDEDRDDDKPSLTEQHVTTYFASDGIVEGIHSEKVEVLVVSSETQSSDVEHSRDAVDRNNEKVDEHPGVSGVAQSTHNEPSSGGVEPTDIVYDSILGQGDVEIILKDIYSNIGVPDDMLLSQFEIENSERSQSEEEMIAIVQGPVQSQQSLSPQLDTRVFAELADEEDESMSIRLRLSSSDEEATPGSSKETDDKKLPHNADEIEKVTETSDQVENPGDVITLDEDATPIVEDRSAVATDQTEESTAVDQIVTESEQNIPQTVKQDDEKCKQTENVAHERLQSDHEVIDNNRTSESDKKEDDVSEPSAEEAQEIDPETGDNPPESSEDTETKNQAAVSVEIQDIDVETKPQHGVESQPKYHIESQLPSPAFPKAIEEMDTVDDAHRGSTGQSSHLEKETDTRDGHDHKDQFKSCDDETSLNRHSVNDGVSKGDGDEQKPCNEQEIGASLTPAVGKVKSEPTFVLSPPATRAGKKRKRRVDSSTQCTPKPDDEGAARDTRSTVSEQVQVTPKEPSFIFSPPSTRTRSARKMKLSADRSVQKDDVNAESPELPSKRPRRKTRSSDQDSGRSSPPGRSRTPENTQSKSTPSRRTQRSPARKTPGTPTRSSTRIRTKLDTIEESAVTSEEAETATIKGSELEKKSTTSKQSTESVPELPKTPTRRSTRLSMPLIKTPTRKSGIAKPRLSPLEEELGQAAKRRRQVSETSPSRVTRSTGKSAATRRKVILPSSKK